MEQTTATNAVYSEAEVIEKRLIPGVQSRVTLFRLRRAKRLGFLNVCGKIFYEATHIQDFLGACERKAKAVKK